jgi:DNA-binding transcriptional LysR family regulator
MMDAGDLLLLDAIIAEGGVSAAAAKLGQPKTTLSRRLRRLEKAVGSPLFDRNGRKLRLTAAGRAFAAPAEAIRVALASAQSLARAEGSGSTSCVRIVSPFLFGHLVLTPYLGQFLAQNPDMRANLQLSNAPLNPLRENFDLAIRIQRPDEPYLIVTLLAEAKLRLFGAPELAARIQRPSDLAKAPIVNTSNIDADEADWRLIDGDRVHDVKVKVRCTVNDPEAACRLVADGVGIGALPEFLANEQVAQGSLTPILPHIIAGKVGIHAVLPPNRTLVPVVRMFLDGLRKELSIRRITEPIADGERAMD